jgi:hypothetical protein
MLLGAAGATRAGADTTVCADERTGCVPTDFFEGAAAAGTDSNVSASLAGGAGAGTASAGVGSTLRDSTVATGAGATECAAGASPCRVFIPATSETVANSATTRPPAR